MLYSDDPPSMFQQLGIETGDRVIADDYNLLVFPTEPTPKFLDTVMGTPIVRLSSWLETFEQRVRDVRERDQQPWNRQKALAYRLVHLVLTDDNPETRHIQLVTAIEVLLNEQDRPRPILDALNQLLVSIEEWPDGTVKTESLKSCMTTERSQ